MLRAVLTLALVGCIVRTQQPDLDGRDVRVVFLHTSDWHSRLLPYEMVVGLTDEDLGLGPQGVEVVAGGAARIATLIRNVRQSEERVVHVDSGDVFQGAPIFNQYFGEVEFRVMSAVGVDVAAIGNHEFDLGGQMFVQKARAYARFPMLAANYVIESPDNVGASQLGTVAHPYTIINAGGLRVGVIGLGNLSSITSIFEGGNSLGITPLHTASVVQDWVDFLRPQVDLVVLVSHLGLTGDERLIPQTEGVDIIFGGHLHVVLSPPKVFMDCQKDGEAWHRRGGKCTPRPVLLVHSGAFMKFLGKLAVTVRQAAKGSQNWEVVASNYELLPVTENVKEDPQILDLMEPYALELQRMINLVRVVGHAPTELSRFGLGTGDSELGNLVTGAMQTRRTAETDFALTNSLGIRTNINPGPITVEEMFNVFPFENTIVTMFLSGREVQEMFDFVADRSSGRGCQSQAQIAGATVVLDCQFGQECPQSTQVCCRAEDGSVDTGPCSNGGEEFACSPCGRDITIGGSGMECDVGDDCQSGEGEICTRQQHPNNPERHLCGRPVSELGLYELAANDFIARGGSGFQVLERNTSQINLGVSLRDSVIDYMASLPACGLQVPEEIAEALFEAGRELSQVEVFEGDLDLTELFAPLEAEYPDYVGCALMLTEFAERECEGLDESPMYHCRSMQQVRSALLCLELPCLRIRADGRIERIFPE